MAYLHNLAAVSAFAMAAAMQPALAQDNSSSSAMSADTPATSSTVLTGENAYGSWQDNKPGVQRQITAKDMPKPGTTESSSNSPGTVARPDNAMPTVMDGFKVELVASGIENPRAIRFAPNGDMFVSNSSAGEVLVYRFEDGKTEPVSHDTYASGLKQPYGIAFYPKDDPKWVYVAESDGLRRFPYAAGDMKASGEAEVLFDNIDPNHHWTRDVVFSDDGKTMYYSVGSGSNVGLDSTMDPAPEGGLDSWVKDHPLGVAWGGEERRAAVLAFDPEGKNERYFATGLRNCAGMTLQPETGNVWCVVNERDELGDNLPPDYATSVADGAFYGWPWYYIGDNLDPRWEGNAPDIGAKTTVPDVLFQPHSAPLNITFYKSDAFGPDYKGDAFVAMHGSWNRGKRTGYKVVKLDIGADGKATGVYQDFMTGFVVDADTVWGRPVGVAVGPKGSLFVSEDGSGTIWKVSKK